MGRRKKKAAKKEAAAAANEQAAYDKQQSQSYWSEYSKWQSDAAATRDQQMSSYQARYANNPDMYKVFSEKAEADYQNEMTSLQAGERGQFLNKYYQQHGAKSGLSMDEWYTKQYGNTNTGVAATPDKPQDTRKNKIGQKLQMKRSTGAPEAATPGTGFFKKQGWW